MSYTPPSCNSIALAFLESYAPPTCNAIALVFGNSGLSYTATFNLSSEISTSLSDKHATGTNIGTGLYSCGPLSGLVSRVFTQITAIADVSSALSTTLLALSGQDMRAKISTSQASSTSISGNVLTLISLLHGGELLTRLSIDTAHDLYLTIDSLTICVTAHDLYSTIDSRTVCVTDQSCEMSTSISNYANLPVAIATLMSVATWQEIDISISADLSVAHGLVSNLCSFLSNVSDLSSSIPTALNQGQDLMGLVSTDLSLVGDLSLEVSDIVRTVVAQDIDVHIATFTSSSSEAYTGTATLWLLHHDLEVATQTLLATIANMATMISESIRVIAITETSASTNIAKIQGIAAKITTGVQSICQDLASNIGTQYSSDCGCESTIGTLLVRIHDLLLSATAIVIAICRQDLSATVSSSALKCIHNLAIGITAPAITAPELFAMSCRVTRALSELCKPITTVSSGSKTADRLVMKSKTDLRRIG